MNPISDRGATDVDPLDHQHLLVAEGGAMEVERLKQHASRLQDLRLQIFPQFVHLYDLQPFVRGLHLLLAQYLLGNAAPAVENHDSPIAA